MRLALSWLLLAATSLGCVATPSAVPQPRAPGPRDAHRPLFHFTAQQGWINDPNGLVFFQGQWHLGFQALWPRTWGHATSRDLIHWTELPPMLLPDQTGDMWSGSAAVDWHNTTGWFADQPGLVAAFTSWGPPQARDKRQSVGLAFSTNAGRSWSKFPGNPVLGKELPKDFRDPKIFWHDPTRRWIAIVTVGHAMQIHSSPDLRNWVLESTFGEHILDDNVVWECPDLFPLTVATGSAPVTKWVLQASYVSQAIFAKPPRFDVCAERYFVGEFDGHSFRPDGTPTNVLANTFGDAYATVTWSDVPASDGRRVAIGWMNHWGYANKVPTKPWQGALSVPRVLTLQAHGPDQWRVRQSPIAELRGLRGAPHRLTNQPLGVGRNPLEGARAETVELILDVELGTAREVGVRLRRGSGEETVVGYRVGGRELFIDRARSGATGFHEAFAQPLRAPLPLAGTRLRMHILLDRSSVEVFADDGAVYLAALIFPDPKHQGLDVYADGGAATLRTLELFPLRGDR